MLATTDEPMPKSSPMPVDNKKNRRHYIDRRDTIGPHPMTDEYTVDYSERRIEYHAYQCRKEEFAEQRPDAVVGKIYAVASFVCHTIFFQDCKDRHYNAIYKGAFYAAKATFQHLSVYFNTANNSGHSNLPNWYIFRNFAA